MLLADPERWLFSPSVIDRRLSLAVWVADAYFGESTKAIVSLDGVSQTPARNVSGFYCFSELVPGIYDLDVRDADARRPRFFPYRSSVDVAALPANSPIISIDLLPAPNFPFPASATLIRGVLKDSSGVVVADATVEASLVSPPPAGIDLQLLSPTTTAPDGQIIVALRLSGSDLALLPTIYPFGIPVLLELRKAADIAVVNVDVEEGQTNSVGVITF